MNGAEKIMEGFSLAMQGFGEVFENIVSVTSKLLKKIDWETLAKLSKDPQVNKYFAIYRRTKNSRIKKKQIKKIKAILYKGRKRK